MTDSSPTLAIDSYNGEPVIVASAAGVIFFRGTHKVRNSFGSIFNYLF